MIGKTCKDTDQPRRREIQGFRFPCEPVSRDKNRVLAKVARDTATPSRFSCPPCPPSGHIVSNRKCDPDVSSISRPCSCRAWSSLHVGRCGPAGRGWALSHLEPRGPPGHGSCCRLFAGHGATSVGKPRSLFLPACLELPMVGGRQKRTQSRGRRVSCAPHSCAVPCVWRRRL